MDENLNTAKDKIIDPIKVWRSEINQNLKFSDYGNTEFPRDSKDNMSMSTADSACS